MTPVLATFLKQHGASEALIEQATAAAEPLELPTRHILLNQGEQPEYCYFLLEGICHACYLTPDGRQFSKEFYWDQDVLIGFESLLSDTPSPFLLETLSASKLIAIPIEIIRQWRLHRETLYLNLLERQLQFKEHKERFMLIHNPEERFLLFSHSFPELISRLADYQVASYLGITSTSLSRIKKRQIQNESQK
ncbi:Crp/Fnr family transcriptional regulator [Photobacterium minamisatsumaniensis]|uniref:Crp/Fnr family transcriptional regulator n=1 Tax=Photobacterium minamisatsumaniensis TaxID=2910233 RepID=UPI003D10B01E